MKPNLYWVERHHTKDDCYYRLARAVDLADGPVQLHPAIFDNEKAARDYFPGEVLPGEPVPIWDNDDDVGYTVPVFRLPEFSIKGVQIA